MRLTFLAGLLAFPVHADTTCAYGRGGFGPPTTVTIQTHEVAFAEVLIQNTLTHQYRPICTLTLYGIEVQIEYLSLRDQEPDDFLVTVPPGFRADPPRITVEDFSMGRVLIWMDEGLTG